MATRSPYDALLGIPRAEVQGETALFPAAPPASANLFPPAPAASPAQSTPLPAPTRPAAAPTAAVAPAAPGPDSFVTINEFFGAPQYQQALTPEKQELEAAYRKEFLSPARMEAAGASAKQQTAAIAEFNKRKAKVADDAWWDVDLFDRAAVGLASAVGGVARVLGADSIADFAKADAERIRRDMYSNQSRYQAEVEQHEAQKLAKEYGGEDNVPWWEEVKLGMGNFFRQPVAKTVEALGSSIPALATAFAAGAAAAPAVVGVSAVSLVSALLAAGDSAEGAYDKIVNMTEQQLLASPEYRELRATGVAHDAARKTIADQAVKEATLLAAPIGAISGAIGSRVGAEAILMRGAAARGLIKHVGAEAGQEGVEEGAGQAVTNKAVQRADPDQRLMTGVAQSATEGALAGAGIAGTAKVVAAAGNRQAEPPAQGTATPTPTPSGPTPLEPDQVDDILQDEGITPPTAAPAGAGQTATPAQTAAALSTGAALPERIQADPIVQNLMSTIGDLDPEAADPAETKRLTEALTGRVAYVQAAEAVRAEGGDPVETLAAMSPKDIHARYLVGFKGPGLWTENVRRAVRNEARAEQRRRENQPAPAPATPEQDIPSFAPSPSVSNGTAPSRGRTAGGGLAAQNRRRAEERRQADQSPAASAPPAASPAPSEPLEGTVEDAAPAAPAATPLSAVDQTLTELAGPQDAAPATTPIRQAVENVRSLARAIQAGGEDLQLTLGGDNSALQLGQRFGPGSLPHTSGPAVALTNGLLRGIRERRLSVPRTVQATATAAPTAALPAPQAQPSAPPTATPQAPPPLPPGVDAVSLMPEYSSDRIRRELRQVGGGPAPETDTSPLPSGMTVNWRVPNRRSRAGKTFDESILTQPILPTERQAFLDGNPVAALASIARRHANQPIGQFAADLVRTVAADVKTAAGRGRMRSIAASWQSAGGPRGTVSIALEAPVTVHAAVHEFAHALTANAIRNPVTGRQKEAVRQLREQMEWVGQNLPPAHPVRTGVVARTFTDPAEFAAEVYTNPLLQNYLKSVPSSNEQPAQRRTGRSLWDSFIDAVFKLMKLRRTAYADTLMTLREIDDGTLSHAQRVRQAANRQGQQASRGTAEGSGDPLRGLESASAADEPSGSDHPVVPSAGTSPGASVGAVGPSTADPVTDAADAGTTGANLVVEHVAGEIYPNLPEVDQANVLAAAAAVGTTPEKLMAAVAAEGVPEGLEQSAPDVAQSLKAADDQMTLFAQMPLRARVQTALDAATRRTSHVRSLQDELKVAATGEMPTVRRADLVWAKAREKFVDSTTPFLKMIGWDQNLNLWKSLKLAGSKQQEETKILNEQLDEINRAINEYARRTGISVSDAFADADRHAVARYVAAGANEELALRNQEYMRQARTALQSARAKLQAIAGTPAAATQAAGIRKKIDQLAKRIQTLTLWQQDYDRLNDLFRGRDVDANGAMTSVLPGHRFIGGMTRREAQEMIAARQQRLGPAMAEVDALADRMVALHRFWADRALQSGIYFPSEAAEWSQNRFKGGSGDYYVPVTGNDNLRDQEDIYAIGGLHFKDYLEEGRSTVGDGAYMSVVHYAAGMAQRIAHRDFMGELYANAAIGNHGMQAVAYSDPTPGNKRTFLYKEMTPSGRVVTHKIALNNDEAADALVGANRFRLENSIMRGLGSLTSTLGFMVTQATMMFGPINAYRDFGEKSYSMLARYTDVPKAEFTARAVKHFGDIFGNFTAAWRHAHGNPGTSQADKDLAELVKAGGLSTRTGSVNREADKIVSAIRRQFPGFREIGALKKWIGDYNEAFEIHSALAIYRALKESTKLSIDDRAFRLLDSMNFNQSGANSPALRALYLFFNPTVQGARNTYESMIRGIATRGPAGTRKRAMAVATLAASAVLYGLAKALGGDDEDYGNRVDALASNTVTRSIPLYLGPGQYLRIPVPFGAPSVLWNTAIGAMRFQSGRFTAEEAMMHMLQGAAEHTVPFPISQVDIAQDPSFWFMKTIVPQYLSPIVNIASNKNDFGNRLTTEFYDEGKPASQQGKRNTPEEWKQMAQFMARNGMGDFAPEKLKETFRLAFVGPLDSALQFAIGVEQKEGEMHYFGKALGLNRVYTKDSRGIIRRFYDSEHADEQLRQQVYLQVGEPPKGFRGEARLTALREWVAGSNLSLQDQEAVMLPYQFDSRMRKARKGESGETEEDVMRAYLRARKAIYGEN